jgi:hypothetical protein
VYSEHGVVYWVCKEEDMQPKSYVILERAVEEGIERGWNRAHKYVDNPDENAIRQAIGEAVMGNICEVFSFTKGDLGVEE